MIATPWFRSLSAARSLLAFLITLLTLPAFAQTQTPIFPVLPVDFAVTPSGTAAYADFNGDGQVDEAFPNGNLHSNHHNNRTNNRPPAQSFRPTARDRLGQLSLTNPIPRRLFGLNRRLTRASLLTFLLAAGLLSFSGCSSSSPSNPVTNPGNPYRCPNHHRNHRRLLRQPFALHQFPGNSPITNI